VRRPPISSERSETLADVARVLVAIDDKTAKGKKKKKKAEETNRPTITTTTTGVIDCSTPRKKFPRQKYIIDLKHTLQIGDVTFKGKNGGSSGYEALIFRREGSVNETTGKISKPFEFTLPVSCLKAIRRVTGLMLGESEE
jgi:hypothetical protein